MTSTPSRGHWSISRLPGIVAVCFLILAWHLAALRIASPIILPSPLSVGEDFFRLCCSPNFLPFLGASLARVSLAFFISMSGGIILGLLSAPFPLFRNFLSPFFLFFRSTPVLALIILLLIWFPRDFVPVVAAVLMALPLSYLTCLRGASALSKEHREVLDVYRVGIPRRIVLAYLPSMMPFLLAAAQSSLGLSWKVVVAGEVLSQPLRAIGSGLQVAKVNLDTARAFSWTLATIILCACSDAVLACVTRWFSYDD